MEATEASDAFNCSKEASHSSDSESSCETIKNLSRSDAIKKRIESLQRLRGTFENIIARYSEPISDDDEVDIFSGEIISTTGAGYLSKLPTVPFGELGYTLLSHQYPDDLTDQEYSSDESSLVSLEDFDQDEYDPSLLDDDSSSESSSSDDDVFISRQYSYNQSTLTPKIRQKEEISRNLDIPDEILSSPCMQVSKTPVNENNSRPTTKPSTPLLAPSISAIASPSDRFSRKDELKRLSMGRWISQSMTSKDQSPLFARRESLSEKIGRYVNSPMPVNRVSPNISLNRVSPNISLNRASPNISFKENSSSLNTPKQLKLDDFNQKSCFSRNYDGYTFMARSPLKFRDISESPIKPKDCLNEL